MGEIMGETMTNAQLNGCAFKGWQCFHCGEVFETVGDASDHFGVDPSKEPGCLIKVKYGDERGIEIELRKVEAQRDALQYQISNESTEADLNIQTLQGQHQIALRREEEKGYARGLADDRNLLPSPSAEVSEEIQYLLDDLQLHLQHNNDEKVVSYRISRHTVRDLISKISIVLNPEPKIETGNQGVK